MMTQTNSQWSSLTDNDIRDIISQIESSINMLNQDVIDHPGTFAKLLEIDQQLIDDGLPIDSLPIVCIRYTMNNIFKNIMVRELFDREHSDEPTNK